MYEKLTKYKEENGHCLVPYNYKDSSFGMWVSTQRRNYHKKDWSKLNETWSESYKIGRSGASGKCPTAEFGPKRTKQK